MITEAQVADYLASLNLEEGSPEYILFNRLVLIEDRVFRKCLNGLVEKKFTLQDLMDLDEINTETVDNFLWEIEKGTFGSIEKRKHYRKLLEDLGIKQARKNAVGDFRKYIHRKVINPRSFGIPVDIDIQGLRSGSFLSYADVQKKYLELISKNPSVQRILNVYDDYVLRKEPPVAAARSMVDSARQEPVFVISPYNFDGVTGNNLFSFIISKTYQHVSPAVFDSYVDYLIHEMARLDTDWDVIEQELQILNWEELADDSALYRIQTTPELYWRISALRLHIAPLYSQSNINLEEEQVKVNEIKKYLELCRDVLLTLWKAVDGKMVPGGET